MSFYSRVLQDILLIQQIDEFHKIFR